MIDKISFKSYKIFKEKQTLEIKPITVIIGKNNSGKSVVSKLPTLIEKALLSESSSAFQIVNDGIEYGSELRDLVYGRANRMIELELSSSDESPLCVGVLITEDDNSTATAHVEYWKYKGVELIYTGEDSHYTNEQTKELVTCQFLGLRLNVVDNPAITLDIPDFKKVVNLNTDFIGPIREMPKRDYRLRSVGGTTKTGIKGENSYTFLIQDAITTEKTLVSRVSDWYKKNFEGWELKINQDKAPIFQVELQRGNLKQNIQDAGIGMSQVLPIVTRALQPCENDTLIIVEEPETHLHPAAHGNLAELFVESLAQKKKKYLIETHSQNFVLRLRRLVAEKKLSKDDICIYYVDFLEEENYSVMKKIEVDDFGRVNEWPEGIFNETLDETIAIRTAQLDNSTNGN